MSAKRDFTHRMTNPLRNVRRTDGLAADVYTEAHPYGPFDEAGGTDPPVVHRDHRWVIDTTVGSDYAQARAVWDGDLYIAAVVNPDETDPAKILVWLGLTLPFSAFGLRETLDGLGRGPEVAFYGNVRHTSLRAALLAAGYSEGDDGDLLDAFLDLGRFSSSGGALLDPAWAVTVRTGDDVGEVGEIVLEDGTVGRALDFRMALGADGVDTVYPDAAYARIAQTSGTLLGTPGGDDERDPDLSVWSVCRSRVLIWCNDEWHEALGRNREADVTVTRADGELLHVSCTDPGPLSQPTNGIALETFTAGHTDAVLEVRHRGSPPIVGPLLLGLVPSDDAATEHLTIPLDPPSEIVVQALDPDAWFPPQGGTGWNPTTGVHPIALPAPHAITPTWTNGNRVTPLLDGHAYFTDLYREVDRISDEFDYLLMTNWWIDADLPLLGWFDPGFGSFGGDDLRTIADLWAAVTGVGAQVFLLGCDLAGGPHDQLSDVLEPSDPLHALWTTELHDHEQGLFALLRALMAAELVGSYSPTPAAVAAVAALEGPGTAEAILDARLRPGASHHAKTVVVRNADGLVAWVGGIDLHTNRTVTQAHTEIAPGDEQYHDVQCRIEGPAARDVLRTFISRWNDHPALPTQANERNTKSADLFCTELGFGGGPDDHRLALSPADDRAGGTNLVQIARTFGNCRGLGDADIQQGGSFDDNGYTFAPDGEFTIEAAVLGAVKAARHYIYIEDQFPADLKIATAIADRIAASKASGEPFVVHVVTTRYPSSAPTELRHLYRKGNAMSRAAGFFGFAPPPSSTLLGVVLDLFPEDAQPEQVRVTDDPFAYTQSRWYDILDQVDPEHRCWQMYCLRLPPYSYSRIAASPVLQDVYHASLADRRLYVHSKVAIVDDVWATIGSANMNVRSHTSDTEINCCFVDGRIDRNGGRVSVRDLRRALWAEHLGVAPGAVPDVPGHHPEATAFWARGVATQAAARPTSDAPSAPPLNRARLYTWPYDEVYVGRSDEPRVEFLRAGAPMSIPGYDIDHIPLSWWLVEGYGKAPWAPDADTLIPPPIGSDRFSFDGEAGTDYVAHDIEHR